MTYTPPNPHKILYEQGLDPDAPWTITRAQPIASLVAEGVTAGFTSSRPPPAVLCGRTIFLHAGAQAEALCRIDQGARDALASHEGLLAVRGELPAETEGNPRRLALLEREPWRDTLERLPQSAIVGKARLIACFKIAAVIIGQDGGRTVYADVSTRAQRDALGVWPDYDKWTGVMAGDWQRGRWAWFFDTPVAFRGAAIRPVLGYPGLWRHDRGIAHQQQKASMEAYHAAVEAQEGGR